MNLLLNQGTRESKIILNLNKTFEFLLNIEIKILYKVIINFLTPIRGYTIKVINK